MVGMGLGIAAAPIGLVGRLGVAAGLSYGGGAVVGTAIMRLRKF